ncbi:hypothetical protein [Streptomyces luteolus]|uniref:Uncharacterized protein n=1 Tax=Streptomyces luteolus TaxID=3043615 RepID=A0ABT6SRD3_9ACTN|nr:hypothetical protein [Streptomyces sp. B-S-A12]MDI3418155.1 hypothetical protein [Streptomyces sp. B-S-A12]
MTARPVDGLGQLQLSATSLEPSTAYILYARREGDRVPLVDFTTDVEGAAPQVLVFARFTGVYDDRLVVARATGTFADAGNGDRAGHAGHAGHGDREAHGHDAC